MDTKNHLQKLIKEELTKIRPVIMDQFPWESDRHYGNWCVQTYKFVYYTVPLLEKAASMLSGPLKEIMQHHRKEELGHEKFVQRDAQFLGRDCEKEEAYPETLALYEPLLKSQEGMVVPLLGYAFALENISAAYCDHMAERVLKKHKIKPSKNHMTNVPASFLTLHAVVDQEHTESGWECLNYLPTDTHNQLIESTKDSFQKYQRFLIRTGELQAHQKAA